MKLRTRDTSESVPLNNKTIKRGARKNCRRIQLRQQAAPQINQKSGSHPKVSTSSSSAVTKNPDMAVESPNEELNLLSAGKQAHLNNYVRNAQTAPPQAEYPQEKSTAKTPLNKVEDKMVNQRAENADTTTTVTSSPIEWYECDTVGHYASNCPMRNVAAHYGEEGDRDEEDSHLMLWQ